MVTIMGHIGLLETIALKYGIRIRVFIANRLQSIHTKECR